MTLYYDEDEDAIVENHPDYAEFDDEGHLVLDMAALRNMREEKVRTLIGVAVSAAEAGDEYVVAQEPKLQWVPHGDRDD